MSPNHKGTSHYSCLILLVVSKSPGETAFKGTSLYSITQLNWYLYLVNVIQISIINTFNFYIFHSFLVMVGLEQLVQVEAKMATWSNEIHNRARLA